MLSVHEYPVKVPVVEDGLCECSGGESHTSAHMVWSTMADTHVNQKPRAEPLARPARIAVVLGMFSCCYQGCRGEGTVSDELFRYDADMCDGDLSTGESETQDQCCEPNFGWLAG